MTVLVLLGDLVLQEERVGFVLEAQLQLLEHLLVAAFQRLHEEEDFDLVLLRVGPTVHPRLHHLLEDLVVSLLAFDLLHAFIRGTEAALLKEVFHLVQDVNVFDNILQLRFHSLEATT